MKSPIAMAAKSKKPTNADTHREKYRVEVKDLSTADLKNRLLHVDEQIEDTTEFIEETMQVLKDARKKLEVLRRQSEVLITECDKRS